jgi:threonine/homoserine efflux transporter RhtA
MIEAIGWLTIAAVVMIVGKAIAKKLFPEDWKDEEY